MTQNDYNPFEGIDENHEAWSTYLAKTYGPQAAAAFAVASDIVYDAMRKDLEMLEDQPRGTHLGQLPNSWLVDELPPQFLTRYDYEFVFSLKYVAERMRRNAAAGMPFEPKTVIEELFLYLIDRKLQTLGEDVVMETSLTGELEDFLGTFADDMDLYTWLYSGLFLPQPGDSYHFDRWLEEQFWTE